MNCENSVDKNFRLDVEFWLKQADIGFIEV